MDPQRARYARFETRRKVNKELSQLLVELNPPSPVSLSQEKLETLCIQCSEMAILPEKERDAGPVFCKLVPPSTINKAFDSTFTNSYTIEWPGYDPRFDSRFYAAYHIGLTLLDYTLSGEEVREPLVRTEWHTTGDSSGALTLHRHFYPNTRILWGVIQILQADSAHHPHLACLHMDDAPADEGLRPSELISAVKLMKQALHLDKLNQFRVNPVYVYSFSNYEARILETYYESGTLFVRKTPYIDFAEENEENIKLYLRWMMNKPSGPTTFAHGNDSVDVSDESSNAESS